MYFDPTRIVIALYVTIWAKILLGVTLRKSDLTLPYYIYQNDGQVAKEGSKNSEKTNKKVMFLIHGWPDNKEVWNEMLKR